MTLNLYEKWDKATLTAHLISASCAKNFGDWNSLALCLFTESEGTNKLISDCGNELSTPSTSTEALEVTEVKVFAKKAQIAKPNDEVLSMYIYCETRADTPIGKCQLICYCK